MFTPLHTFIFRVLADMYFIFMKHVCPVYLANFTDHPEAWRAWYYHFVTGSVILYLTAIRVYSFYYFYEDIFSKIDFSRGYCYNRALAGQYGKLYNIIRWDWYWSQGAYSFIVLGLLIFVGPYFGGLDACTPLTLYQLIPAVCIALKFYT